MAQSRNTGKCEVTVVMTIMRYLCVCVWKSHNESEQKVKSQMFLRNSSLKVSSLPSWAVACTSTRQQGKEMQREGSMRRS